MLRGPEVSSQPEDGGLWISCSTASLHEYAWRAGILRLPPLLLWLTRTEVAAGRLLNCLFFITRPWRPEQSCCCCHAASSLWHFCTRRLVCVCHGAVTSSLLAMAHGKFTQCEVRPSSEPVTCCGRQYLVMFLCGFASKVAFTKFQYWILSFFVQSNIRK